MTNDIRVSEWDGTPWAGEASLIVPFRHKTMAPVEIKAATGPGVYDMLNLPMLSSLTGQSPQKRMAQYLKTYKVGWFYKAESKISADMAGLKVSVSHEDAEGDNEAARIEPDLFVPWDTLDPIGQFLRLMERPNPYQTGRVLRQKTQIRYDMAGAAFWYLEGVGGGFRTPTAIYGISPSRMWPVADSKGILVGWVMDRDRPGGGVPFTVDEILPFMAPSADDDVWGTGVVEAVFHELPLTELMARHTADLLTTGGRLAGMLWPKDRALEQNEFEDAQRAWRNVTQDANAARRLLIFPEPMEYVSGASTPAEIGIPDLAALNRENILTAFPISPYQLGVPVPGGLNSALTRVEDRRDYWEGTIHPRVEMFEETIQIGLLARYEAIMGTTFDFDIAEPNLDNASSLIEKAGAMKALISLGFDPKAAVESVGLDHIKYLGPPPEPAIPAPPDLTVSVADSNRRDAAQTQESVVKAAEASRDRVVDPAVRRGANVVASFLAEQHNRVGGAVRTMLEKASKTGHAKEARAAAIKDDPGWWDSEAEDARLAAMMNGVYVEIGRGGLQTVADDLNRFIRPGQVDPVIEDILRSSGARISDINAKTRKAVQDTLAEGTRRGYSINQLIEGVDADGYLGLKGLTLDNGLPAFGDLRAETIARTEAMLSYNRATVTGYGTFGVQYLLAYDGDGDEACAARDGREFTVADALDITDHPNGTLVWSPITKAVEAGPAYMSALKAAIDYAERPPEPIPAPVVNVAPPVVNVAPPEVTVHVPTQSFTDAIDELKAVMTRPRTRTVQRDATGHITVIVDD